MTLTQIRMFLATVKYGNFTKAAEQLYITSPGLIKQINAMEKELGFQLFNRNKKSVTLTAYGTQMLNCFSCFISDYDKLCHQIESELRHNENVIYLGRPEQLSPYVLDFGIDSFIREHPDIKIMQHVYGMNELYQHIHDHQLDVILAFEDSIDSHPDLDYRLLLSTHYQLLVSKVCPQANNDSFDFSSYTGSVLAIENSHDMLNGNLIRSYPDFFSSHKTFNVPNIENLLFNTGKNIGIAFADEYLNINPFYNIKRFNLDKTHYLILAYRKDEKRPTLLSFIIYLFNFCRQLEKTKHPTS